MDRTRTRRGRAGRAGRGAGAGGSAPVPRAGGAAVPLALWLLLGMGTCGSCLAMGRVGAVDLSCNRFGFLFGGRGAGEDPLVARAVASLTRTGEIDLWTETQPAVPTPGGAAEHGRCASRATDCTCYWCEVCDQSCGPCATCSCCGVAEGNSNYVHVYGRAPSSDRVGCERALGALHGWLTGQATTAASQPVWKVRGGSQYASFQVGLTWHAARAHCQSTGVASTQLGHHHGQRPDLVSITSPEESAFVQSMVAGQRRKDGTPTWQWTGCTDAAEEGRFVWAGEPRSSSCACNVPGKCRGPGALAGIYTRWAGNEGAQDWSAGEDCVAAVPVGWVDVGCYAKIMHVCRAPFVPNWRVWPRGAAPTYTGTPSPGPGGGHGSGTARKYTHVRSRGVSWEEARATCHTLGSGAELVSLESDGEEAFVTAEVMGGRVESSLTWIGCRARGQYQYGAPSSNTCPPGSRRAESYAECDQAARAVFDRARGAAAAAPCADVDGWLDIFGSPCATYVKHGHCVDGLMAEGRTREEVASWGTPPAYDACCACGGGSSGTAKSAWSHLPKGCFHSALGGQDNSVYFNAHATGGNGTDEHRPLCVTRGNATAGFVWAGTGTPCGRWRPEEGVYCHNNYGSDRGAVASVQKCLRHCEADTNCSAFVYRPSDGYCRTIVGACTEKPDGTDVKVYYRDTGGGERANWADSALGDKATQPKPARVGAAVGTYCAALSPADGMRWSQHACGTPDIRVGGFVCEAPLLANANQNQTLALPDTGTDTRDLTACFEPRTDYPGNNIKSEPKTSPFACQLWCQTTASCKFFTYDLQLAQCYLKSSDAGRSFHSSCVSGPRETCSKCRAHVSSALLLTRLLLSAHVTVAAPTRHPRQSPRGASAPWPLPGRSLAGHSHTWPALGLHAPCRHAHARRRTVVPVRRVV